MGWAVLSFERRTSCDPYVHSRVASEAGGFRFHRGPPVRQKQHKSVRYLQRNPSDKSFRSSMSF